MLPDSTIITRPDYKPFPPYTGGMDLRSKLLFRIGNSLITDSERAYYRANVAKWQGNSKKMKAMDWLTIRRIRERSKTVLQTSINDKAA